MGAIRRRIASFRVSWSRNPGPGLPGPGKAWSWRRLAFLGLAPVLALTALPLLLASIPAAAQGSGPLTLSTASGSAGQRVLLTGSGFTPGESVQPYWDYGMTGVLA